MFIQLILKFKNNFGKYHPVFPKILKGFFGGNAVLYYINTLQLTALQGSIKISIEIHITRFKTNSKTIVENVQRIHKSGFIKLLTFLHE